jgi:hypothetical protein
VPDTDVKRFAKAPVEAPVIAEYPAQFELTWLGSSLAYAAPAATTRLRAIAAATASCRDPRFEAGAMRAGDPAR